VHHERPSHKECTKKLKRGRELLASPSDGYLPVDPLKLGKDFQDLYLFTEEEQLEALRAAFSEVTASNYSGRRPPERSFEAVVQDREFLVFRWDSSFFQRRMYLKFCIVESQEYEEDTLYVFSLHEDRPERSVAKKGRTS
jgi:hypothetical protein